MNLVVRFVIVIYAALALSGCKPEFDVVVVDGVGELCMVKTPLNAHGVTLNVNQNKTTDFIVITSLNLSGPEITFGTRLLAGTKLEIIAIRTCNNCFFEDRVEYGVRLHPPQKEFGKIPIYMDLKSVASNAIACTLQGEL